MSTLRRAGHLLPSSTDRDWERTPQSVGVGPDQQPVAVWNDHSRPQRRLVTAHDDRGRALRSVVLDGCLLPTFVQPLPGDRILLVSARRREGSNAEVWDFDGHRHHAGDLGDAVEQVLTTPAGDIWVGYFDEAKSGSGPQTHGLARFTGDLRPAWLYPAGPDSPLPSIFDCFTLNVTAETAWTCAYTDFHLVSASGTQATDHGRAPYQGAHMLLVDGRRGALIGGYAPEYDLITRYRTTPDGPVTDGPPRRLVLPDGMELRDFRATARGPELHIFIRTTWYRADLDSLGADST
ncbi:hypothetical protein [Paractinoplanes ovalisporus]|uniref:hypothetical protein n=1 Tax=Paractinoplanes ovalisporus TaxID=2810368 RepID=UPI00193B7510|nr:hypothetical protein [Actinoplanes ovalisporus]